MTDPVINDSSSPDGASGGSPDGASDASRPPRATPAEPPARSDDASGSDGDGPPKPRRRRGSRGGRGRGPRPTDGAEGDDDSPQVEGTADETGSDRKPAQPRQPRNQGQGQGQGQNKDGGGRPSSGQANRGRPPRAKDLLDDGGNDRQPDELPERSFEGKPRTVEAADRAVVRKPRIGDTRPAPDDAPAGGADDSATDADATKPKSRRRRGGRGRGSGGGGDGAASSGGSGSSSSSGSASGGRGGRSGGGRGQGGSKGTPVEAILASGAVELDDEDFERRRGRSRNGRPVGRYLMTVSVRPEATQIAVLEGRNLIEHYVSRPSDDVAQIHGNVYLGRVQNVLPGMEAAFVDIGTPKNAVLYRGDVQYEKEDIEEKGANLRIEQILKAKQTIICQVTKNPIAHKGARLTQEVSLPGRFVVLIPNSTTYGISKRLPDDERKRLRSILDKVKPAQHGLIVRTAAEGVTDSEIQADVVRLLQQWARIEELAKTAAPASLLYREPDMAVRVIREEFNDDYRGVLIDDKGLFDEIHGYVSAISPALADRVQLYDTSVEPLSISERHHVHEQLHKALDRKVWLPSGGSLIIEHTEALTVIDVNTGKNVGTSSLEETVFRNNLEAAIEIAKQLRLRDIGGIIVIDFIDMEIRNNRDEVIKVFRDSLARDKTRTQVFDISELGLVEMTRKRIGEGLLESFSTLCPDCEGRGLIIDQALID